MTKIIETLLVGTDNNTPISTIAPVAAKVTDYGTTKQDKRRIETVAYWSCNGKDLDKFVENKINNCFISNFVFTGDWSWINSEVHYEIIDPRGFKIHISSRYFGNLVPNIKINKGLIETPLIYVKEGKEIILTTENSENYKNAIKLSRLSKQKRITANKLIPGCVYKNKKDDNHIFVGKFKITTEAVMSLENKKHIATMEDYPERISEETYVFLPFKKDISYYSSISLKSPEYIEKIDTEIPPATVKYIEELRKNAKKLLGSYINISNAYARFNYCREYKIVNKRGVVNNYVTTLI